MTETTTSDPSLFFDSIPLMASCISSPRVCDSRVVKPNRIPSLFHLRISQIPEAGHYQWYLLIHPQLKKCMVHSEWPHQVSTSLANMLVLNVDIFDEHYGLGVYKAHWFWTCCGENECIIFCPFSLSTFLFFEQAVLIESETLHWCRSCLKAD